MRRAAAAALMFLWACDTGDTTGNGVSKASATCERMCDELVLECDVGAFPSVDSCLQGCEFDSEQGVDVASQLTCIEDAECDLFAIVECDHAFSVDP